MKVCAFGAPSGELCDAILAYTLESFMREPVDSFEWLMHRAGASWGNMYAEDAGRLHTITWHYVLGWTAPDEFNESYRTKLRLNPIPTATLASLIRLWASRAEPEPEVLF